MTAQRNEIELDQAPCTLSCQSKFNECSRWSQCAQLCAAHCQDTVINIACVSLPIALGEVRGASLWRQNGGQLPTDNGR